MWGEGGRVSQIVWRRSTRSLGLDIGDKRIGVARSDPGGILASPLTIINYDDERAAIEAIIDIVTQEQVGQIVVGLPFSMDGSLGNQAKKVKTFVQELSSHTKVPIDFRDERLTTVTARRLIKEANPRKAKKKVRDDAIAAALILQGYLDEERESRL